jgi:hypothetical protein
MNKKKLFHLIVPVWGSAYSKIFTDICLPLLMMPENLGMIGRHRGDQFVIVTTLNDYCVMKQTVSFSRLERLIQVEIVLIDGRIELNNSHKAMSECYSLAMNREEVTPGETCFVFLTPDSFWPNGTFRRLIELVDSDFKVVMAAGVRVNLEKTAEILKERISQLSENQAISMTELNCLILENIHQLSKAHDIFSGDGFLNDWPSHIYWIDAVNKQLIAHCFHLHPLLVVAPSTNPLISNTIDGDFLENLQYPLSKYYVMQDMVGIELSPSERNWGRPLTYPDQEKISNFTKYHVNSRHWHFFGKRIVLSANLKESINPNVEIKINSFVKIIEKSKWKSLLIRKLRIHKIRFIFSIISRLKRLLKRLIRL